ncbi:hypothetical protein [Fibrella forsythiae]|uniref:DUF805 domain-containing protein n=1 Tax=Fibrella forsythiae TaxID=2817061 RepID=A0ABS3JBY1_9BACT|nr:hypothetical protein [Fibrella forsythiae]MBO0947496.1 hypothetical protein [Fibrella forsythiae]
MNMFNQRTLFQLSGKQVIQRYVVRFIVAFAFAVMPFIYLRYGIIGVSLMIFMLIVGAALPTYVISLFKKYEKKGSQPKQMDYVLIMVTVAITPIVSALILVALIPGLVISAFSYPFVAGQQSLRLPFLRPGNK